MKSFLLTWTLQNLDPAKTAEMHLYKTLLKIKPIASAPSFPQHVQTTVEVVRKPLDTASANVQARLFKSVPVQTAMTETLTNMRAMLAIPEIKKGTKKRLRAKDFANGTSIKATSNAPPPKREKTPEETDDEWEGLSNPESARQSDGVRDSDDDDEDYDLYASRLAASSDEDSDSEHSGRQQLNPDSITEDDSEDDFPPPKSKSSKVRASAAAPKSTTFLPSLSMGGYWSGSESAEDLSDTEPQARKNRRGQQARRALWEKKYGKNANHLKNQPQNRDEGWDPRRGASGPDDRSKRGRGRGGLGSSGGEMAGARGRGRGPMSTGANSDPVSMRKPNPAANAPLHPSWEAAKKAKEQKKAVQFQGKKVVFS